MDAASLISKFVPAKWKIRGEVTAQGEGQLALGEEALGFWQERLGWPPQAARYLATAFAFGVKENVAEVLANAQRLSEPKDFAQRFVDRAGDDLSVLGPALEASKFVTASELRDMLGRIVANDIDHPGSVSTRSVSIAKDLTAHDLREFLKLRRAAWSHDNGITVVLGPRIGLYSAEFISFDSSKLGVDYYAFGEFQQLGLLQERPFGLFLKFLAPREDMRLRYGMRTVDLRPASEDEALALGMYTLSRAGEEIMSLFMGEQFDPEDGYFEEVCGYWRANGFEVTEHEE